MATTAAEGEKLLSGDGLKRGATRSQDTPEKKARLARENTMVGTAKEAERILGGKVERGATRSQDVVPPTIHRENTMVGTAKEAGKILDDGVERGKTRSGDAPSSEKRKADDDAKTVSFGQGTKQGDSGAAAASPKKPKLARENTMVGTAKEAEKILDDKVARGATRSQDVVPVPLTRGRAENTMVGTAKEAEKILDDGVKRGATRSHDKPPLTREGTMVATAKEAEKILGDGKDRGATRSQDAS